MLAFKAKEIEELADVWFFRPLGMVCAYAARAVGLSPTAVTIIGMGIGALGGAFLYGQFVDRVQWGYWAFALLILHGILDSADGQLARLTKQTTELGRILDGVGGYVTHVGIYVAILAGLVVRGSAWSIVFVAVAAAIANIVQAQMYDYHRTSYARFAIDGRVPEAAHRARTRYAILAVYESMQERLAGLHPRVEAVIASRARNGGVRDEDRARYRLCFYWPVRGWNLMGDNTRFYAIGLLVWLNRLDQFFVFILIPMNVALAVLWLWQRRADQRFLSGL